MHTTTASRRYADALVEGAASVSEAELDQVKLGLEQFAHAVATSPDLESVLENPVFTQAERSRVLEATMTRLGLPERVMKFLRLVADRGRIAELPAINEAVKLLADRREGRVQARVSSASELPPQTVDQLRKALEKKTGKRIEVHVTVDPSLIGGVRAQVGSLVFDGSIRAELARLRETLRPRD